MSSINTTRPAEGIHNITANFTNFLGSDNGNGSENGTATNCSLFCGTDTEEWGVFKVIKLVTAFIITILIIVNNLINLKVLRQMRDMGKRMKILLYSLSMSDICLGVTVCLPALPAGALGYWPFSTVACQISGTMNGVAIGVSLWSLTAISIERFVLIRKPLLTNKNQGMLVVFLGISCIWLFSTIFYAFPIWLDQNLEYYVYDNDVITCSFRWKRTAHFMVAKFIYPVLSGSIIMFNNIKIHEALKQAKFDRRKWKAQIPLASPSNSTLNDKIKGPLNNWLNGKTSRYTCSNGASNSTNERNNKSTQSKQNGTQINEHANITTTSNVGSCSVNDSHKIKEKVKAQKPEMIMTRWMINRNLKARLLLVFTSVLFFSTTAPYMITSLVDHFMTDYEMPPGVKFASLWILNTNSFVNFYVYSVIYVEFRTHCRKLFYSIFFCNKQSKNMVETGFSNQRKGNRISDKESSNSRSRFPFSKQCKSNLIPDAETFVVPHSTPEMSVSPAPEWVEIVSNNNLERPRLLPRDDAFQTGNALSHDYRASMAAIHIENTSSLTHTFDSVYSTHLKIMPSVDV